MLYIPISTEIHYLRDDGIGNIQLFRNNNSEATAQGSVSNYVVVDPTIGTVNYSTGYIKIQNLNITALAETEFSLIIKPQSNDVVSAFHQIARIAPSRMTITAISDATSHGNLRAGQNYVFTSSRS